jgi:thiamine-monophosphate kinase
VAPDELEIIDRYFRPLAGEGAFGLLDDAGALAVPAGMDLVVSTDMIAAGMHFLPDDPPDLVARKALRVNLSDIAAKGARPLAYLLGLGLGVGGREDAAWLAAFADGLRTDQALFAMSLLGGDTIDVAAGPVIAVTAFGTVEAGRMVHRAGGRPDDLLFVSGTIGASAAGLALLRGEEGPWADLAEAERTALVRRYRLPQPRVALAPALVAFASAAMDVSDGLVGDCDKLCAASGCGAAIAAERVPLPEGLSPARDAKLVARLLTAGDDYEILAAIPPRNAATFGAAAAESGIAVAEIGRLVAPRGMIEVTLHGAPLALASRAFVHHLSERGRE